MAMGVMIEAAAASVLLAAAVLWLQCSTCTGSRGPSRDPRTQLLRCGRLSQRATAGPEPAPRARQLRARLASWRYVSLPFAASVNVPFLIIGSLDTFCLSRFLKASSTAKDELSP